MNRIRMPAISAAIGASAIPITMSVSFAWRLDSAAPAGCSHEPLGPVRRSAHGVRSDCCLYERTQVFAGVASMKISVLSYPEAGVPRPHAFQLGGRRVAVVA